MLAVIELVVVPGQLCALFVGKARWLAQSLLFFAFFIFCSSSDVFRFAWVEEGVMRLPQLLSLCTKH